MVIAVKSLNTANDNDNSIHSNNTFIITIQNEDDDDGDMIIIVINDNRNNDDEDNNNNNNADDDDEETEKNSFRLLHTTQCAPAHTLTWHQTTQESHVTQFSQKAPCDSSLTNFKSWNHIHS